MSPPNFDSLLAHLLGHADNWLHPDRLGALFDYRPDRDGMVTFKGDSLPDIRHRKPRGHSRWDVTMVPHHADAMPYPDAAIGEIMRAQAAETRDGARKGRAIHLTWHPTSLRPPGLLASLAFHIPRDNVEELLITAIGISHDKEVAADAFPAAFVLKQYLHALAPKSSSPDQEVQRVDSVVHGVPRTALSKEPGIREMLDVIGFRSESVAGLRGTSEGFRQPGGRIRRVNTGRVRLRRST